MNTNKTFQYGNEVGGEKEERRCGQTSPTLSNNNRPAFADPLWSKLREFRIDTPETTYHFATRLANENGWTPGFTARVLEEYRRFLFLAIRAGHPVSPSDAVDQAWHLHLLYTESYWGELCPKILGQPFHHGPSKGGAAEDAKFTDWYERTLDSYTEFFGQHAPADIWPPTANRFQGKKHYRRICLNDTWVIRKPRLPRRNAAFAAVGLGTIPLILAEADGDFPIPIPLLVFLIFVALLLIVIKKAGRGGGRGNQCGSSCGSNHGGSSCGSDSSSNSGHNPSPGQSDGHGHGHGHGHSSSGDSGGHSGHGGGHSCGGHSGCGGGHSGCGGGSSCGGGSCGGGGH